MSETVWTDHWVPDRIQKIVSDHRTVSWKSLVAVSKITGK